MPAWKCAFGGHRHRRIPLDQGKDVLLMMMDSLTCFAMAQREIGWRPANRLRPGATPPFTQMPKLLERTGTLKPAPSPASTPFWWEGDDNQREPISDTVRWHHRRPYHPPANPAIDVLGSISRLMNDIDDQGTKSTTPTSCATP